MPGSSGQAVCAHHRRYMRRSSGVSWRGVGCGARGQQLAQLDFLGGVQFATAALAGKLAAALRGRLLAHALEGLVEFNGLGRRIADAVLPGQLLEDPILRAAGETLDQHRGVGVGPGAGQVQQLGEYTYSWFVEGQERVRCGYLRGEFGLAEQQRNGAAYQAASDAFARRGCGGDRWRTPPAYA